MRRINKMVVVSDTTPIITLIKIGQLNLLKQIFGKVIIPNAVYQELIQNQNYPEEVACIQKAEFIEVYNVNNREAVDSACRINTDIHIGECEAVMLYKELDADLLMMDEINGREFARNNGVTRIMGTIGIISYAINHDYMIKEEAYSCITQMKKHRRWISRTLFNSLEDVINAKFN